VAEKKKNITIRRLAQELRLASDMVRDVLKESTGLPVAREDQDEIFKTARRLGYDFRKLKIGKRMQYRKETLDEVIGKISENGSWGRAEIVKYLRESLGLVERVHNRVFREEFGGKSG